MPKPAQIATPARPADRRSFAASSAAIWLAAALLLGAIFAAYHNSFSGPFVFDDGPAITGNPTIRHLSELGTVLSPPRDRGQTVGGRPIVNLSLAINHALGGTDVRGYHVFNFAVHGLAALLLFGIVRRTLLQPSLRDRFGAAATPLALAIAGLWAVHPLLTESVTYVIQRAESLMGLFYLLTLYCFIRGAKPTGGGGWYVLAFAACLVGMATKEVMATAPLVVLLYDRTFVAGSWRNALATRKIFYSSLAATWLLLGWLVLGTENRGGTAGLGVGASVWTYALTQTKAVVLYLRLAVWPRPLVFDYGTDAIAHFSEALPFILVIVVLLAGVIVALKRWPAVGFLAACFFVILAPSSSFIPIPVQPVNEHRMYLPLAALVALGVLGLYAQWKRASGFVFIAVAIALACLTVKRNEDYLHPGTIWADTIVKRPGNVRAQCYYADVLAGRGEYAEALVHYDEAMRLERSALVRGDRHIFDDILVNSGNVLRALGRPAEAVQRYEEALRIDPGLAAAHFNLGCVRLAENQLPAAIGSFRETLRIDPNYSAAHTSLGSALLIGGQTAEALTHYETALRLESSAKAHRDLGMALLYIKNFPRALTELEHAVQLDAESAQAHEFLGTALSALGRRAEAVAQYQRAVQIDPANARARRALEMLSTAPR